MMTNRDMRWAINSLMQATENLFEANAAGSCKLQPEKEWNGTGQPTMAGEICRLNAWGTYLLDVLNCETVALDQQQLEKCCKEAYAAYCHRFDACPD